MEANLTIRLNFGKENDRRFIEQMYFKVSEYSNKLRQNVHMYVDDCGKLVIHNNSNKIITIEKEFFSLMVSTINNELEIFPKDRLSFIIDLDKVYSEYIKTCPDSIKILCDHRKYAEGYIDKKQKFIDFLDHHCNIPLSGDELSRFEKDFKFHVNNTYGAQPGDRTSRPGYKVQKMRIIFKRYNLNYNIKVKQRIFILSKISK